MKPAFLNTKPRYPKSWQDIPLGTEIKVEIEQQLAEISRQFFGYHLVNIGNLSSEIALSQCPIKHLVNITPQINEHSSLCSLSRELPLSENSVDAILIANELDFAQDPHQILREVDRVIIPNGHVVIVGFNPYSLAGVLKYLPIKQQNILHDARFFSAPRIKDWLGLLSFEVIEQKQIIFSELFFNRKFNSQSRGYLWAEKYIPLLSSMYIVVAKKRVIPLSPIKPKWKAKTNFSPVGASMRTHSANREPIE
ncbi:MAG: SAM-dependent methyltransferase [Paraglaciecola sp.]|jgi:SAM-dependent methyltransferase